VASVIGGKLQDGSGTMAVGGTSQQVFAAKPDRSYFLFQNLSVEDMWINFGVAANANQPSILVVSRASVQFSINGTGVVPTDTVNVVSATSTSAYTAKQF
jgi:hypothetical protein